MNDDNFLFELLDLLDRAITELGNARSELTELVLKDIENKFNEIGCKNLE